MEPEDSGKRGQKRKDADAGIEESKKKRVAKPIEEGAAPPSSPFYCSLLELLAFVLHPGDTESTSTICLSLQARTLYLTSQTNSNFGDPTCDKIRTLLDTIGSALKNELKAPATKPHWTHTLHGRTDCAGILLDFHCTCMKGRETDHKRKKMPKVLENVYFPLFKRCKNEFDPAIFKNIRDSIEHVVVVLNEDLFPFSASVVTTGLHGESRIIRFFFICRFAIVSRAKELHLSTDKTAENVRDVFKDFKTYMKSKRLFMGSSQGTCSQCTGCTGAYSVCTGPQGNPTKSTWMHPIHFMPYENSRYKLIGVNLRHHGFRAFFLGDDNGWQHMQNVLKKFLSD